jgi:hypothetical protein
MQEDKNESGTLGAAIDRNARNAERNYQLESILDDVNDLSRDLRNAGNGFDDLRPHHEEEKERFENEIKKLTDRLKVKDEMIEFDDKNFDQSYQQAKDKNKASDFANPVAILKLRLNKMIATNKEKKKLKPCPASEASYQEPVIVVYSHEVELKMKLHREKMQALVLELGQLER